MPASEILFKSVAELAPLLEKRKLSPVEVVRAFLHQIETLNPKVNAFITITADQALEQARKAEKEIAAGRYRGPLHGLPYAPKDLLATRGIRTTNGAKVTSDWIPGYESTVTTRLNQAGAILIGKLNLLEFARAAGRGDWLARPAIPGIFLIRRPARPAAPARRSPPAWFHWQSEPTVAARFAVLPGVAALWA